HLQLFYYPFRFLSRRLRILQRERGSTEIARRLTARGNHVGQSIVVLARRLYGNFWVRPIEHVGGVKDQDLLGDAFLVQVSQPAVQVPPGAHVDGRLVRSGHLPLRGGEVEPRDAKLTQMSTDREHFDLKGNVL